MPPPSKAAAASPLSATPRSRLRKAATPQKIPTNLSAHPRTDPVNALSVLLRLLTSLPSRIGGCQYKLTQAEHALSLHLVSVLDPYVYHGVRALASNAASGAPSAPRFGLIDQPTEIIDAILSHVDARRDLLNIGLVCMRLRDVVFPRHFEYRFIRCKVSAISVWNHLALHRGLAANVRRVEIMDERASGAGMLIPRGIIQGDTDLESTDDELTRHTKQERFLARALGRMTGLREFKWACNHSPLSIAQLWPTLMLRAATLNSINICDNLVFSPRSEEDDSNSESEVAEDQPQTLMQKVPDIALTDMESVTFRSTPHSYGASKNPELGRIAAMLHQCVNLKELDVTYIAPRALAATGAGSISRTRPLTDEFLTYGRWAKLTTLTLTNLRGGSHAPIADFLAAHPTLEVLHLDISIPNAPGLVLPPSSLPLLREIKASRDVLNAVLGCPSATRRPLEVVRGFRLAGAAGGGGSVPDSVFLAHLNAHADTVRTIALVGWSDTDDIRRLAAAVPGLQHLDVGRRLGGPGGARGAGSEREKGPVVANLVEWTDVLTALPALVAIHGIKFFYEVAALPANAASTSNGPGTAGAGKALAHMSMMERSRMRKNDEIAGVLAWRCPRLRRVDHWEDGGTRVVVLLRDADGARWEVRRARQGRTGE